MRFGVEAEGGAAVALQLRHQQPAVGASRCATTLALLREQAPWLEVDGEMHGDVALDAACRAELMPRSTLTGDANLLVLPNIDAANISYNLLKTAAGGGIAIGPVLLGRSQAGAHPDAVGDRAPHRQHDGPDRRRRQRRALNALAALKQLAPLSAERRVGDARHQALSLQATVASHA